MGRVTTNVENWTIRERALSTPCAAAPKQSLDLALRSLGAGSMNGTTGAPNLALSAACKHAGGQSDHHHGPHGADIPPPSLATRDAPPSRPKSCGALSKLRGAAKRTSSPEGHSSTNGYSSTANGGFGATAMVGQWGSILNDAQTEAREARERERRVADKKLSFDEHFQERENSQARKALSDVDTLMRDVRAVRRRLSRRNRGLLDPNGKFLQILDVLTLFALAFTVFVTPYEIGFLNADTQPIFIDVLNIVITATFFTGIVANFLTPFRSSQLLGEKKIKAHRLIAINYMRGWFILDVISTIPYEAIAVLLFPDLMSSDVSDPLVDGNATSAASADFYLRAAGNLRLVRLLRIMRLLKLGRSTREPTPGLAHHQPSALRLPVHNTCLSYQAHLSDTIRFHSPASSRTRVAHRQPLRRPHGALCEHIILNANPRHVDAHHACDHPLVLL